jgi:hypothetical protein
VFDDACREVFFNVDGLISGPIAGDTVPSFLIDEPRGFSGF